MVGILIIAHAPLASALAQCASHVYSCDPQRAADKLRVLDVVAGADVAATVAQARELLAVLDDGAGVLIFTDAFGSTPGNVAAQLADAPRAAVVAGVNLPMLLRALCYREGALADMVERAIAGGKQGVVQVAGAREQSQPATGNGQ